ncbi:MAG: ATP-binding cassette domain-containing protein, partial [Candidatus Latescibacteria bacterium]|nr:ATP-binding cassette domain-containing protein [bacterium]MBD3423068.1 ATP-binding cassette domain-containing protein [Candidatus Latescibacterota bacterium]
LDFIESLPGKFETVIGERGIRLSGGQCQRLSIARTILKNPAIIVFDEAMSSLDTKAESLIQAALKPLYRDKTTIIVAHRLSSITDADNILVLKDGSLVEHGRHHNLLEKGGVYKSLWDRMSRSQDL